MSGGWIEGSRRRGPALACYFPAKPASGLVASEPNIQAISRDVQRLDHFRGGCYSNLPLQESTYCSRFFRALRRLLNSVAIRTHRAWVSSNNSRHGGVPVNGGSSVSVEWFASMIRAKTLSCWHQYLDECPPERGRNPRCFNGLPYRCGFPQIKIVCQQIRGHSVRVLLDPAARLEPGARWVNS